MLHSYFSLIIILERFQQIFLNHIRPVLRHLKQKQLSVLWRVLAKRTSWAVPVRLPSKPRVGPFSTVNLTINPGQTSHFLSMALTFHSHSHQIPKGTVDVLTTKTTRSECERLSVSPLSSLHYVLSLVSRCYRQWPIRGIESYKFNNTFY